MTWREIRLQMIDLRVAQMCEYTRSWWACRTRFRYPRESQEVSKTVPEFPEDFAVDQARMSEFGDPIADAFPPGRPKSTGVHGLAGSMMPKEEIMRHSPW